MTPVLPMRSEPAKSTRCSCHHCITAHAHTRHTQHTDIHKGKQQTQGIIAPTRQITITVRQQTLARRTTAELRSREATWMVKMQCDLVDAMFIGVSAIMLLVYASE